MHGSGALIGHPRAMTDSFHSHVPVWSGDPAEFEHFVIARRWYEKSLKSSERSQAAPRVWARLSGPAKAVVRHLDPDDFESHDGLMKLLSVLRESPLQQLPIPDSFARLDQWNSLRRRERETIPELLIREEDLYTQMVQALQRARDDRAPPLPRSSTRTAFGTSSAAPSQTGASPKAGQQQRDSPKTGGSPKERT